MKTGHKLHCCVFISCEYSTETTVLNYHVQKVLEIKNQRTSGPVNAHLISWPSKAQNIQNLESFHKFFLVQISKVVPEKIRFEFLYVHDLPQGQEITLTFNNHIPSYIQLDDCSY